MVHPRPIRFEAPTDARAASMRRVARRCLAAALMALAAAMPVSAQPAAKEYFGAVGAASAHRPAVFGRHAAGCVAGAAQLPESGPTWQAMRLSRNRHWGHPELVDFVQDLSREAARLGWRGLYVGDMSQPRGGPMLTGHRSHQSGLDVDIWMKPALDLTLSPRAREGVSSDSMRAAEGAYVNRAWTTTHMRIIRAAAKDRRVARIFVFPGAKVAMCDAAGRDRDWLRKVRPWWGHHYHFHVRLACPRGSTGCEDQAAPPPGDGCADARQWQAQILNPPPPDPNAPPVPPRPDLTLADLPPQCSTILGAR